MNDWLPLIAPFVMSFAIGAISARIIKRRRPKWSWRRREWTAAMLIPSLILAATALGVMVAIGHSMTDATLQFEALFHIAMGGVMLAVIVLVGGLIGAAIVVPRDSR